jgi:hypothetical protein
LESDFVWASVKDSKGDSNDPTPTAPAVFKKFLRGIEILLFAIINLLSTISHFFHFFLSENLDAALVWHQILIY